VESSSPEIPSATEPLPGGPGRDSGGPAIRASDRERDAATHRLQEAFADGRLDDAEFDERPVLHVRGFAYKGTVEVRSRPPGD
jgi:Domain of unknown function (DUF1707)